MGNAPLACQGEAALNPSAVSKNDDERAKRLAEALRENLRKRKRQARGQKDPAEGEPKS